MSTVLVIGPYRFFFVSLDHHEPPHVHVRRDDQVAKFWLDPIVLERSGGFGRSELNTIVGHVAANREILLEKWHEFFDD